jgi:hypothetical protein
MYSAARNCAERRVDGAEEAIFSFEKHIENEASPFRLHPFAGLLTLASTTSPRLSFGWERLIRIAQLQFSRRQREGRRSLS